MHDIAALEGHGVVAAFVASTEFRTAARAQATDLGFAHDVIPGVFVPHPIQDRTDSEMRDLADDSIDAVLATVTHSPR